MLDISTLKETFTLFKYMHIVLFKDMFNKKVSLISKNYQIPKLFDEQ